MVENALHGIGQLYPEIIVLVTLCAIVVADLLTEEGNRLPGWLLLGGLGLAGMGVLWQTGLSERLFYDMIAVDPFASFFKLLLLLAGLFVVYFAMNSRELEGYRSRLGEYYMLLAGMMLGMMLMVGATNLLLMYLAFELTSISSYVLVGFTKQSLRSSEASMKYIIYGAVSSGIMLYGISLLVGVTGATDIYAVHASLSQGVTQPVILNMSVMMILVGLGFKIAVVPFHFWAPDIYEGAPVTIAAILAVASKIAALGMLIRVFSVSFAGTGGWAVTGPWELAEGMRWNVILAVMAAMAMILGNLTALRQDNIKRMLAYSSIAHAGYLLMGVVILTGEGLVSILVYLFVYLFMTLGAFYIAMLFSDRFQTESIEGYKGLGHLAPFESVAMTVFLVALIGLPPTGGFVAKLYIFGSAVSAGWIWLVAVAGVTTVISLFYYIRVARNLFLYQPEEGSQPRAFGLMPRVVLLVLLIPTLLLGIYFAPLLEWAQFSTSILGLN